MLGALWQCESYTATVRVLNHSLTFLDLPSSPGLLPKWQLFVTVLAIFNSVQNFATLRLTRRIYNNVPPMSGEKPLTCRRWNRLTRNISHGSAS
jgi:hypothetical protein